MKAYVYYATQRPVSIGTCPSKGIQKIVNYNQRTPIAGIGEAWGAVLYNRELDLGEVCAYELKFGGETEL